MKIILKICVFLLCFITIFSSVSNASFTIGDLSGTKVSVTDAVNLGNKIITMVTTIGSIISVIVLIVIGLKYMMGSIEEKAQYKKSLMPYVIGATLVFAASTIAGIIYNVVINM